MRDTSLEPSDNFREILQNVVKPHGVSNMRKLGHLNNFIKLLCSISHHEEKFGFTYEEIIIWCIDIQQSNEGERTQALRLVRKMITVNAMLFPTSVANSLIAVGTDGLQERDRMVRAAIAIVCELGGGQAGRPQHHPQERDRLSSEPLNEALITTILHLLNHPQTRQYVRADVELEQILAPFTDFHYRHNADTSEGQLKEDRDSRFLSSRMAIVAAFRIINLCKVGNSGIQSLIGLLSIPNMEVRKGLLEVLYEIFRLPLPIATQDFTEALLSVDPSRCQDSWRLSDGFVAAEAKVILPHRARSTVAIYASHPP
ncbi:hypothetical protein CRUP_010938 [Coryphaenoides rupestris]|nr:hypothetical protein CRUP_010938 [Coryphaenoides rupestris]